MLRGLPARGRVVVIGMGRNNRPFASKGPGPLNLSSHPHGLEACAETGASSRTTAAASARVRSFCMGPPGPGGLSRSAIRRVCVEEIADTSRELHSLVASRKHGVARRGGSRTVDEQLG